MLGLMFGASHVQKDWCFQKGNSYGLNVISGPTSLFQHSEQAIPIRLEAIASRLEAIASRLEANALIMEAIASRLDAITSRLEAIPSN